MPFKAFGNKVVVEKLEPPKQVGLIHIPDKAQEKPQTGRVIAIGRGHMTEDGTIIPLEVKVGDLVLFNRRLGLETEVDGKQCLVFTEHEIFGAFE